jgi:hypothetical protein
MACSLSNGVFGRDLQLTQTFAKALPKLDFSIVHRPKYRQPL